MKNDRPRIAILAGAAGGAMAIAAMESLAERTAVPLAHLTDTFHPPAGINPLLIVINDRSWSFLLVPVGAGVVILVGFAYLWHNVTRRGSWPERWW
jgi:CBS-domain-containing membrane protein